MNYSIEHKVLTPTKTAIIIKYGDEPPFVDSFDLSQAKKRSEFISNFIKSHKGFESEKDKLAEQLSSIADQCLNTEKDNNEEQKQQTPLKLSEKALGETDTKLVEAAKDFLRRPNLIELTLSHIELMGLVGEHSLALGLYLIYTSRLLDKPLAGIVLGSSSSGKSFACSTLAKLFPSEVLLQAHRLTPAALQYMNIGSLVHRIVIAG